MENKPLNRSLHAAKATKQDEFYTQLSDIEKELRHYAKHFKNKTVLCNCDDPRISNFFKYFINNFEKLGLKKVITTCYKNDQPDLWSQNKSPRGIYFEYSGEQKKQKLPDPTKIKPRELKGDGDFRSEECVNLLKQADIVVTNPPFSLFREYVTQLVESGKKFICIGNQNAISYKEIFSLIKTNKLWLGYTHPVAFIVPNHYEMREVRSWRDADGTNWRSLGNACWFTNIDIQKRHEELPLYAPYKAKVFPTYDNYIAIEVSRYKEIPEKYPGVMGVPVTFLEHYNPDQFEIVGSDYEVKQGLLPDLLNPRWKGKTDRGYVGGKRLFAHPYPQEAHEMKIQLKEITVEQLVKDYADNAEAGVVGYGGKLDIRPPYQREFIYKDKQRDAVIDTVRKDFPLNVMYWAVRDDGGYEVIDGQQRTISICQYVEGVFSINDMYFHNLQDDEQEQIRKYKCMVYLCSGDDSEKLDWFQTINIAGMKLTDQELRNAVYHGPWTADAKRYFSKTGCPAYGIGSDYVDGSPIRQDYLETAIDWLSEGEIKDYMSKHQHDKDAKPLWNYFQKVIEWVKATFPDYRREMKHVRWGPLYNAFKDKKLDAKKLAKEVAKLMEDDEVGKKSGIYPYLLTKDERSLNLRAFSPKEIREAYERQKGKCVKCGKKFEIQEMEGDHVKPWHEGGKTNAANCQMLCKDDNRRKSGK